ncbi:MAG TPA: MBL fold metallo-hydrolase [Gemmatimonadaceae bacterium]|nr:MBL fold metallo-hydrolase [Gemmatimonadaceae bacterium]
MRVRFWGTRGSIPSPGPHTVRYGGNTPCVEVRTDGGALAILDAGSGIRELGRTLMAHTFGEPIQADLFLSHTHWDHIQGLPFFDPLFRPDTQLTIWSIAGLRPTVERMVRDQMDPAAFPVPFTSVQATVAFGNVGNTPHHLAGYDVRAMAVRHPGGAAGYRLSAGTLGSGTLVYVSDNELGPEPAYASPPGWRDELVAFVGGASVLVHDATYTEAEYERHRGWGHSHYGEVVELALEAGVERLVLFHHHPERSDIELDEWVDVCRAQVRARRGAVEVMAAVEGDELTL